MNEFVLEPNTLKKIPEVLKSVRTDQNITQVQMGKKMKCEQTVISNMERMPPKGKTLHYLAKYLKLLGFELVIRKIKISPPPGSDDPQLW